jgi:hypothetical protein
VLACTVSFEEVCPCSLSWSLFAACAKAEQVPGTLGYKADKADRNTALLISPLRHSTHHHFMSTFSHDAQRSTCRRHRFFHFPELSCRCSSSAYVGKVPPQSCALVDRHLIEWEARHRRTLSMVHRGRFRLQACFLPAFAVERHARIPSAAIQYPPSSYYTWNPGILERRLALINCSRTGKGLSLIHCYPFLPSQAKISPS